MKVTLREVSLPKTTISGVAKERRPVLEFRVVGQAHENVLQKVLNSIACNATGDTCIGFHPLSYELVLVNKFGAIRLFYSTA